MKAPLRLILIMLLSSLAFSCAKLSKITVKSDSRSNIKVLKEEKKVLQKEKVRFRKKLVEDKKADLINHYLKAQYFSYKKNYEKALIEIKKALLLDPKNPEMLMFSAKFLLKIDKYYLALEECQKLLEFNKSHREANLLAGRILYYLGNFEGAISLLKRTLNNNPVPLDAYLLLAHIYRKTNRKQEAEDLLLTVTLKNAKNPSLLFTVAGDLLQRGKIDKAIKYLKKSISINPGNPKPSDLLSYIFEEQGRYEEANKILLNYISNIGFLDTFYFRIGKNFLRLKKILDLFLSDTFHK